MRSVGVHFKEHLFLFDEGKTRDYPLEQSDQSAIGSVFVSHATSGI